MDNTTAIAYLNHMGGTRSQSLAQCALQLWQWCLQRGITISAEHLPGVKNIKADVESRTLHSSAEWMLHPMLCQWIMQVMGPCRVDLFATRLNSQLPHYISWRPDPFAVATNAFQIPWLYLNAYAFPPFCLVGRCLQKIKIERSSILLIAPVWPTQSWYPVLLESLVDIPMLLPQDQNLLSDPFNQRHPMMVQGTLWLAAWKVSGNNILHKEFQRRLQSISQRAGAQEQIQPTYPPGENGTAGVFNGRLIPFHVISDFS